MGRRPGSLNRPKPSLSSDELDKCASPSMVRAAILRTEERICHRGLEKEDRDHEYRLLSRLRLLLEFIE